jgi:methyl-accepting chemotaxis protein-2 (aspartate sensor receptor)
MTWMRWLPASIRIARHARAFRALFPEGFARDSSGNDAGSDRPIPILRHGGMPLNMEHGTTDRFTVDTGVTATIFVRGGIDFIRISTSIKDQENKRAVGTPLDYAHPAHARLLRGERYVGLSSVFGVQLMTQYDPIVDTRGQVIGATVVGLPLAERFHDSLSVKLAVFASLAMFSLLALQAAILSSEQNAEATGWAAVIALLCGAGVYLFIRRSIAAPLCMTRRAAERIAAGDLTALLHVERRDEIGHVMHALNATVQGLARIVVEVRSNSDGITAAAREISEGSADLSCRTESQVGSLQQTASALTQMTGMVKQNAEAARAVNGHIAVAAETARRGEKVVSEVVATMATIRNSAAKIADIVGAIDALAFQTSLLSFNAAVEAARAGEQGRGFAIVAAEVRHLAQRSAVAAREIRELTEASLALAESGDALVTAAGQTMDAIMAAVRKVDATMSAVSSASQEQHAGIDGISKALANIDEAAQQSAALVEQASAAASHSYDSAVKLSQSVRMFKLAGG